MKTKVTFTLPSEVVGDAQGGVLLGEFNNWDPAKGINLRKKKDGSLTADVQLEPGQTYEYRYFLSDGRWVNDRNNSSWKEAYGQHVENNIISIPLAESKVPVEATNEVTKPAEQKAAAPKKAAAKKAAPKKAAASKTAAPKKAASKKVAKKDGENPAPPPVSE